jgi:phosphoribosylformimino-5-aminoimidazole carboxamide ribotide isomerase
VVAAGGGVPVQVGGGYRSVEQIEAALEAGAARVIVGTAAISEDFLGDAATRFGTRLAVAVDVRDGVVAVEGWTATADLAPAELARRCAAAGLDTLLVTSTARDGSLAGPDLELLTELVDASGLDVLAAGGIRSLDDLRSIRDQGCAGAVVGSAIWLGRFSLPDALAALA